MFPHSLGILVWSSALKTTCIQVARQTCSCAFFFLNKLFFRVNLDSQQNSEEDAEISHMPAYYMCLISPIIDMSHQNGCLLQLMNLPWDIIITQSSQFTLRFTLCFVCCAEYLKHYLEVCCLVSTYFGIFQLFFCYLFPVSFDCSMISIF